MKVSSQKIQIQIHSVNDKIQAPPSIKCIQAVQQQKKQKQQKSSLRMTLHEYLQSTNLKREIRNRSKNRQQKKQNLLNPPAIQQYFKLNQQWKNKKTFNSWITKLRELCRQYIQKDSHYVQIIRIIDKMAEFVKEQIQTINKNNLILQSYLTEASYWPPDGSNYGKQQLSFISPEKSIFLTTKDLKKSRLINQNAQKQYYSGVHPSSEPKINYFSRQKIQNLNQAGKTIPHSSTCIKQSSIHTQSEFNEPRLHKNGHIFSFKDQNSTQINKKQLLIPHVKPFDNQNAQNELNIIQQEVQRLSLMSRFDLNRKNSQILIQLDNQVQLRSAKQQNHKKQFQQNQNKLKQKLYQKHINNLQVSIPLRQFKQAQQAKQAQQVHLKNQILSKSSRQGLIGSCQMILMQNQQNDKKRSNQSTQLFFKNQKSQFSTFGNLQKNKTSLQNSVRSSRQIESSPTQVRWRKRDLTSHPKTIIVQTPTTFKRQNNKQQMKNSSTQIEIEIKSQPNRQNITKRYQNYINNKHNK